MKLMIQRLAHEMQGAPGTVFVVGAGTGAELPLWRELASPHLVLAEAHPRQAEELARRTHPARNEEVWAQAIVANPATHATLQILNNPLYSSLQSPNELTRHYPNLRVTDQVKVAARSLGESIESLMLDDASAHLLVIDTPGQAWDLLSTTPVRLLQQFACIVVHCGIAPLYAGDRGRSDITDLLEKAGFDVEMDDPDAIHPRATVLLKRNDIRVKISRLEAQLRKREDEHATQVKLGAERDARLEQLTREHDKQAALISRHKVELDEANRHVAEQQKLATDRQAQLQKLTEERDAQAKLAAQHMAELDGATKAFAEQQKSAAEQAEKLAQTLTAERDAQTKLAGQHMAELDKATKAFAEQQKSTADQAGKLAGERDAQAGLAAQYKTELDKANKTLAEQQESVAALQERIQTVIGERDAQTKLAAQHIAELDKASGTLAEAQESATALQERIQAVIGERDAQIKLATQHMAELDKANKALAEQQKSVTDQPELVRKLTGERDVQTKLAAQHKIELDKLEAALSEMRKLADERKALLDKVGQQSQERGARIIQLEKEHAELSQHQQRLDQEMIRAEAQVGLIKDVLLRDHAL